MKGSFAALALAASALANPMPQAVTSAIAPESSAPSGCSDSRDGKFQITVVNVTSAAKRSITRRQAGTLELTLEGGELKDQDDRTGYIASNFQFQFDAPPQAGALFTTGFSVCGNNSLALGGSAIFYQCYTGGFYNLYDRDWADHCVPIYIVASSGGGGVTQISDNQPQVPTNPAAPVTQISDGQPQAGTSGALVTQISDGQPQAPTNPAAPVTQISDGQVQAPTNAPITQISDGQVQAPTGGAPVTQISDGQVQAPSGAPVTQISDGQVQAPTNAPITQISDGQVQAPTQPVVSGNATVTTGGLPEFTGAAASSVYGLGALAAGAMGVLALL